MVVIVAFATLAASAQLGAAHAWGNGPGWHGGWGADPRGSVAAGSQAGVGAAAGGAGVPAGVGAGAGVIRAGVPAGVGAGAGVIRAGVPAGVGAQAGSGFLAGAGPGARVFASASRPTFGIVAAEALVATLDADQRPHEGMTLGGLGGV